MKQIAGPIVPIVQGRIKISQRSEEPSLSRLIGGTSGPLQLQLLESSRRRGRGRGTGTRRRGDGGEKALGARPQNRGAGGSREEEREGSRTMTDRETGKEVAGMERWSWEGLGGLEARGESLWGEGENGEERARRTKYQEGQERASEGEDGKETGEPHGGEDGRKRECVSETEGERDRDIERKSERKSKRGR